MPEKDSIATMELDRSIAGIIAAEGRMEERKALGIVRALCSRYLGKIGTADLPVLSPQRVLLSKDGKITLLNDAEDTVRELYLPPEYRRGVTPQENTAIYGLGMLLLYLVTGQEKKSGMDVGISNPVIREAVVRCTALDSKRRFQSLNELYGFLNREYHFPKKRIRRIAVVLSLCLAVAAAGVLYLTGRSQGNEQGGSTGYQAGYREGYENGVSDAPGIGIEEMQHPDGYGNFAGNLNAKNGAFAVSDAESIYYVYRGKIYAMDPYTKKTRFLTEHETITHLSCQDGWLYYLADGRALRLNTDSGAEESVSESLSGAFCIHEGTIYLDDAAGAGYLYGIDTQTLEVRQLNAQKEHPYLNVTAQKLFYTDANGYLFSCDHDGGNATRLLSRRCRDIDLCGDRLYCLTAADGQDTAGILVRMSPEGGDVETLTNQPISRFVATESGMFYIPTSSGRLEWMTPDGKTRYTVCDFAVSDFNLAGGWIFYRTDSEDALYRMRVNGTETERIS